MNYQVSCDRQLMKIIKSSYKDIEIKDFRVKKSKTWL